jgi:predicted TIM-barrel fold metal-dependent hydrolase
MTGTAAHQPAVLSSSRREFLGRLATATLAAAFAEASTGAAAEPGVAPGLVDVNVNLSRWPLRRLPCDQTEALVEKLRSHGVTQAWAGSFDALLHRDLPGANARLASDCRRHGPTLLLPFGSIDPTQPDWEAELRHCAETHRMPGIRLHPNYHGYRLDDARFAQLLKRAAERGLIVQLALVMEDERMMHPLWRVEPVEPAPLAQVVRQTPGLRLVLINALRTLRGTALQKLIEAGNVCVEISMLEGVGGIQNLLQRTPVDRVLFGSHAPLFYFESAELKLRESPLTPAQLALIRCGNARRLFGAQTVGAHANADG